MIKFLFFLYAVIFGTYILFTRQPDFFDSEQDTATIHFERSVKNNTVLPKAVFLLNKITYSIDIDYPFNQYQEHERVAIIYETSHPQAAKVYRIWGYWITYQELLASVALLFITFQLSVTLNKNGVGK